MFTYTKIHFFRLSQTGVKPGISRQSSRNSSLSGPSKGSLPPSGSFSRPGSRPPSCPSSRPPTRPHSRAPSPSPFPSELTEGQEEDSLSELPQQENVTRFRVTKTSDTGARPRFGSVSLTVREKSPGVSLNEADVLGEKQYQTVHAGKVNQYIF